jgi:hypothetical protein
MMKGSKIMSETESKTLSAASKILAMDPKVMSTAMKILMLNLKVLA